MHTSEGRALALFEMPGVDAGAYERVSEKALGSPKPEGEQLPEGLLFHAAGAADGSFYIVDAWEDAASFGRFAEERILPHAAQEGMVGEPQVIPLHNYQESVEAGTVAEGVGFLMRFPGATIAQYEAVMEELFGGLDAADSEAADGGLVHLAAHDGEALYVFDVWASPEQFQRFGEQLRPALEKHGVTPPEPKAIALHHAAVKSGAPAPAGQAA